MAIGLAYWVLMLVWFVFGLYWQWSSREGIVGTVLLWVLFLLLGWKVFGPPLHG